MKGLEFLDTGTLMFKIITGEISYTVLKCICGSHVSLLQSEIPAGSSTVIG